MNEFRAKAEPVSVIGEPNPSWFINSNLAAPAVFRPNHLVASAWTGHIPFARWIVQVLNPTTFVELGTHTGTSYFAFCQAIAECQLETKAHAIDTWQGDKHAGFYGGEVFESVVSLNGQYEHFSKLLRLTFDDAKDSFEDETIDLLHIDGLHTYEAVKHDFENWLPKMSKNGVVLFHDIAERRDDFGVYRLWEELAQGASALAFQHSHGLGVLQLGNPTNSVVPSSDSEKAKMVAYFEQLGSSLANFNEMKSELDAMKKSRSWKITAPLRTLGTLLERR